MPALDLFLHEEHVGVIEPVARDHTRVSLQVDRNYLQSVLLSESFATLPGRSPASSAVSNFRGGYVPEGNHRERMAAKRRIDKENLFSLLTEFGGSIAGAVTLREQAEPPPSHPTYEVMSDRELAARLKQALDDSDQGVPDDSRSTLPGYQPKVLAALFNGEWAYPRGRAHSTHILKPQVPSHPTRIFDEYYSHLLSRHMGLSQYDSQILSADRTTYLAIERFDRIIVGDKVMLHHQEALAQALSLDWRDTDVKFQEPAWPNAPKRASARTIGQLLGSIPGGDAAITTWIQQLTYNVAIGNNDAHAKNVALMHLSDGTELSQIYDALPNLFQEGIIKWDLALAVDGQFDQRRISGERLLAEVASWGVVSQRSASETITNTLIQLESAVAAVAPPPGVSPGMIDRLHWNVTRLLAGAEISEPKRRSG